MLYVYEFEIVEDEGYLLALPYDFEGGTQGCGEREVAIMAADWLRVEIEQRLMSGESLPEPTFGHRMQSGCTLVVAVEVSLDTIDAIPAHEAATMLGVSRSRVSQMISAGILDGFKKGRDSFVAKDSLRARMTDNPKAGRPRKDTELRLIS